MGHLRQSTIREVRDPAFALFLVAIVFSLIKGVYQPGVEIAVAGSSARVVPGDAVLVLLAIVLAVRLVRRRAYPRGAVALTAAAVAFGALIVLTAFANGGIAVIAAGKLVMLGVLVIAAIVLVDTNDRLWIVAALLVAVTTAAVLWGLVGFVQNGGGRQPSFLGEHDLAALSTACLVIGLASLHCRHRLGRLPLVAGIVGCLGITLGAALASLLGVYLAAGTLLTIAKFRRSLSFRAVAVTVVVALALTGSVSALRTGQFGFLRAWFAPAENAEPGQYAGSWSQRLIFVYVGGRVFLANPVLGTGWWGELPPSEFSRFLPDARARFPDEPLYHFPAANRPFIPQQTFDQVAYELGVIGLGLLLALIVTAARDSVRSARRWPSGETDELAAYLAAPWLASLMGAIAGAALFGGTPMAAIFWITFGLIGALSVLATSARGVGRREPG